MFYENDDFFNQILRSHEEGDGKKGKEYMKAMLWIRIRSDPKLLAGSGSGKNVSGPDPDSDGSKMNDKLINFTVSQPNAQLKTNISLFFHKNCPKKLKVIKKTSTKGL
jgi:hypothetical protein